MLPEKLNDSVERGISPGIVLTSSPFIPAEWIQAHGFTVERLVPDSGGIEEHDRPFMGRCPRAHLLLKSLMKRSDAAAVVLTSTCDQMRRSFDLLNKSWRIPSFLFHVPATWQTPAARKIYLAELNRLGAFLYGISGRLPSQEALAELMKNARPAQIPPPANIPLIEPQQNHDGFVHVGIIGESLCRQHRGLLDFIRDCGARTFDLTPDGNWGIPVQFSLKLIENDPLDAFVQSCMMGIPGVFQRPDTKMMTRLREDSRQFVLHGVILVRNVWCDLWKAAAHRIQDELKLPVLILDLDEQPLMPPMTNRIAAFVEILSGRLITI